MPSRAVARGLQNRHQAQQRARLQSVGQPAKRCLGARAGRHHRGAGGRYLIAMPILATPQGIVAIVTIMAAAVILFDVTKVIVLVLVIMAIDLGVLLADDRIIRWIGPATLQIIARVAGIPLLALAVQMVIWALRDLGALAPLPSSGH